MAGITIVGTGKYVPGEPVTNEALSRVMDTSDEWIKQRTGISQRHFASEGVGCSDLAVEATAGGRPHPRRDSQADSRCAPRPQ